MPKSSRALLYMHDSADVKESTLLAAMDSHGGRPKSPFCVSETLVFGYLLCELNGSNLDIF
jgi:hypothetical protein